MATRTTATVWSNSSDANFRAWGSWFSGCFTAAGFVSVLQTFATGTNWTDVTTPAAANTARVTEVWRMDDAAQATTPIFIKVEYGETSVADCPGFRLVLATGHSGGGTMTGILYDSGATYIGPSAINANSMTHYSAGADGNWLTISMATSGTSWANTNTMVLSIERRKNGSGVVQTTGVLWAIANGSTRLARGYLAASGHPTAFSIWGFPCILNSAADASFDSKIGVFPLCYPLGVSEIGTNVVAVPSSSYPAGTTFSTTVLGAAHTYIALQLTNLTALSGAASVFAAIRYE